MRQIKVFSSTYLTKHNLFAIGLACLFVFSIVAARQVSAASQEQLSRDGHLLTVYDGDFEKTFVTTENTVAKALRAEGVVLESADRVEPAAQTELVAGSYSVNVYRARPVTVIDGSKSVMVLSSSQNPKKIVEEAGSELHPEDKTEYKQATDPLESGGVGLNLVIDRATAFKFNFYGNTFTARTQAETVGQMLEEKEISLGEKDGVSLPLDAKIRPGMDIRIWRDGKQTITVEEAIKKPVEEVRDADREIGYREVKTAGKDGKAKVTYEIVMKNGVETKRKKISSVIVTKPVKEVVVIGTKDPANMPYTGGGSKDDWLAASNIPSSQWGYADWLVQKESGWNPNAVNSSSGACGLGQQLPCGKWAGTWNDPVDSLNGMHGYVMGRYGSWQAAVNHSRSVGWY